VKKALLVFGTRPEAIKMASIVQQLKKSKSRIKPIICVTGQHREMLDQVLKLFGITPDYDLDIMQKNQDLFDITANALIGLKDILKKENPDVVLVQGDTTTAFAAGLAAYYFKIPIGHVEAGLRTHNKYSPFPEEMNRHLLSVISDFHFAPTEWAKSNLLGEGVPETKIWVTGNTVIDALLYVVNRSKNDGIGERWVEYFERKWNLRFLPDSNGKRLILVTGHRRENFGKGFENICSAIREIADRRDDVIIIYPVHLNPNVQRPVRAILGEMSNVHLIEPLEYEPFAFLMNRAYLILTDSGGIQEEAPSLGKPTLVMRDTTERPEGIKAGIVKLVGTEKEKIVTSTLELLDNPFLYRKMATAVNPYGNGNAAEKIVNVIIENLT